MDFMTALITIMVALFGVQTTILIAAVPWAFSVHGRLATIDQKLSTGEQLMTTFGEHEKRLSAIEVSVVRILERMEG
jgi:hypothetical protein